MMNTTTDEVEIEVNGREAYLMIKYGYPFEDQKNQLKQYSRVEGWHKIQISKFYLEHIIGDLCRSIREVRSQALIEELDTLCDMLEGSLRGSLILIK